MKQLLITIAAVLLVGCGESQQSAPSPEVKPAEPVAEATKPEPPTAKAPDISIHDAAKEGNIEAVKQHLDVGVNVNAKQGIPKWTPLHLASLFNRIEVVELLIAKGADVNAINDEGSTPVDNSEIGLETNPNSITIKETADLLRKHGGKTGEELKAEGK